MGITTPDRSPDLTVSAPYVSGGLNGAARHGKLTTSASGPWDCKHAAGRHSLNLDWRPVALRSRHAVFSVRSFSSSRPRSCVSRSWRRFATRRAPVRRFASAATVRSHSPRHAGEKAQAPIDEHPTHLGIHSKLVPVELLSDELYTATSTIAITRMRSGTRSTR